MLVLLPPSEGKASGGAGAWSPHDGRFGVDVGPARTIVVDELAEAIRAGTDAQRSKLLGAKGANLADAVEDALALPMAPPALPAFERYTGVVWAGLNPGELTGADRRWFRHHVAVISGLLGIVGGADPVPAHRLKMSVGLGRLGKLSRWWRPHLDQVLGSMPVIDLLPNEHADAVPPRGTKWVSVRFVAPSGAAAGHHAKTAKGRCARRLIEARPRSIGKAIDALVQTPDAVAVHIEPADHGWSVDVVLPR